MTSLAQTVSCIDGYDPDALHVDKARAAILACITPVSQTESVPVRDALGRVLARNRAGDRCQRTTTRRWMDTPCVFGFDGKRNAAS